MAEHVILGFRQVVHPSQAETRGFPTLESLGQPSRHGAILSTTGADMATSEGVLAACALSSRACRDSNTAGVRLCILCRQQHLPRSFGTKNSQARRAPRNPINTIHVSKRSSLSTRGLYQVSYATEGTAVDQVCESEPTLSLTCTST